MNPLSKKNLFLSLLFAAMHVGLWGATIPVPIEIVSPDAINHTTTVMLNEGGQGLTAKTLYLQVHNLRYQGALSIRLNGADWFDITNSNVTFEGNDGKFGGIGGIQATVRIKIPVASSWTKSGAQTLDLRFNGTDGRVTALRILDIKLLNASGVNLVTDTLTPVDPTTWKAPAIYNTQAKIDAAVTAGKTQWSLASSLIENPISKQLIKASCSSCHFQDGGDLKYFNYSNETISARAQFHGLSEEKGNQLAAYIRSLDGVTKYPPVGRPWNPPFQPWAGADDALHPEKWAAGGGLESVLATETDALSDLFKYGTDRAGVARIIDHDGKYNIGGVSNFKNPPIFSIRAIRVPLQFPDWNDWLPRYAPEDLLANSTDLSMVVNPFLDSYAAFVGNTTRVFDYLYFIGETQKYNDPVVRGDFRLYEQDLSQDIGIPTRLKPGFSRDEGVEALEKYQAVKTFNIVRTFALEDRAKDAAQLGANGERGFPSGGSTVFDLGPHISANNWSYRQGSVISVGKLSTAQWYQVQLTLNAGMRQVEQLNHYFAWDYQTGHLLSFNEYTGVKSGLRRLALTVKQYETRDNGYGVSETGFSMRGSHPFNLYWPREANRGYLDTVQSGLWIKSTEALLEEWLDVVTAFDLNGAAVVRLNERNTLPASTMAPVGWNGLEDNSFFDENHLDNTWRLIPLLREEGISETLLRDFAQWASKAWPGPATNPTKWSSLFTDTPNPFTYRYGNREIPKVIYSENFEAVVAPNYPFSGMRGISAIKDAKYVKSDRAQGIPKNGGGILIGTTTLTSSESTLSKNITGGTELTAGIQKLRLRTRVAVDSFSTGTVKFRMGVGFNTAAPNDLVYSTSMSLDSVLSGWKFQTYESTITIPAGATKVLSVQLLPTGSTATNGKIFYLDNVEVIEEKSYTDTVKPALPKLKGIKAKELDVLTDRNGPKNGTTHYNFGFDLSWAPVADTDVIGYRVYRSIDGGVTWSTQAINDGLMYCAPQSTTVHYFDLNIEPTVRYSYFVTAVDRSGNESSKTGTITPLSIKLSEDLNGKNDPPFLNPEALWIESTKAGALRWFASDEWDSVGYNVYAAPKGSTTFVKLNATPLTGFNYTDLSPATGKQYYVTTVDIFGQENVGLANSNVVVVTQSNIGNVADPYVAWALLYNLPTDGSGDGAMTASPAGDQIPNLLKAGLGISPRIQGYQDHFSTASVNDPDGLHLTLTYSRPTTGVDGFTYGVEVSPDLIAWNSTEVVETSRVDVSGVTKVTTKDTKTGSKRFIRLRITK